MSLVTRRGSQATRLISMRSDYTACGAAAARGGLAAADRFTFANAQLFNWYMAGYRAASEVRTVSRETC